MPMLACETTNNTFTRTSQGNLSTYAPHTIPCTTQASSQQQVDRYGAQFDDMYETTGQREIISSSLDQSPDIKMTTELKNSCVEDGNQLLSISQQSRTIQGNETPSHTPGPDPGQLMEFQEAVGYINDRRVSTTYF